jgi:hypothetical protein
MSKQLLVDKTLHGGDAGTPFRACCGRMAKSIAGVDESNWFYVASDWHGDSVTPTGVEFFDSEASDLRINFCPFCGAEVVLVESLPEEKAS